MDQPLVTIVCLCYNQGRFVKEAIRSVLDQTYPAIQLIVVDDGSADNSVALIREAVAGLSSIRTLFFEKNLGNCTAFNRALPLVRGEYVIDFAADDILLPERIERQVRFFSTLDDSYGVIFSDAVYVDEQGRYLRSHYEHLFRKKLLTAVPQGDVYRHLLSMFFIASPTMMVRKKVFDALNGYDESLRYEDFDFWVRSSRNFNYAFQNEALTKIRRVTHSMSTRLYKCGDRQLHSTYIVCCKALQLNRTPQEQDALAKRLKYELRQSVFTENRKEAVLFYELLKKTGYANLVDHFLKAMNTLRLPLSFLRAWYQRIRFGEV